MQMIQQEFENLINRVVLARNKLIYEGLEKCGYSNKWLEDEANRKRCKIVDAEDDKNGGFKTAFYLDDEKIFDVVCYADHKTFDVVSELKMVEKENE